MNKFIILISLLLIPIPLAYADNSILQIIKVSGTATIGVQNFDYTVSPAVTDITKTMIFMSVRHIGDSNEKEVYRSWELINPTTLRFYGSSNVPANNDALTFIGYIVEFTSNSDMTSQQGLMTVAGGQANQEFTDSFTAVNTTSSFFQFLGQTANHADLTWGVEEFARMRIISSTSFGYEPFDAPNSGPTDVRYQIIDLANNDFFVQRGTAFMPDGTALLTITPPIAIDRTRTIVFASHMLQNGILDAEADEHSFTLRVNALNQLEFDRDDAVCNTPNVCDLQIRWEAVSFPADFVNVQYLQFDDTVATGANVQQTGIVNFVPTPVIFANSIAIGTVHTPLGLGQGRSASGGNGAWDQEAYTVELMDADTVNVVINDGQQLSDVWFQVIEFEQFGAGDINSGIQQQPSCCFFFIKPLLDWLGSVWTFLLINSLVFI